MCISSSKINSRYLYRYIVIGIAICLAMSCKKFLAVDEPISSISNDLVFTNDNNANSAVAGMYVDMYNRPFAGGNFGSLAWIAAYTADELHNKLQLDPPTNDLERNEIQADNGYISAVWIAMYRLIYQANSVITGVELSSGITAAKKDQFKGEALFLRAFTYFYLVNFFGDVPLVLTTDYKLNASLSRAPQSDVYNQIEADLLAADGLLLDDYPTDERVRPNRSTVKALLARFYLYRQNWQKAIDNSTAIISQTRYALVGNLNNVFFQNSTEAIWQLKPSDNVYFTREGNDYRTNLSNGTVVNDAIINSFSTLDQRKVNWVINVGGDNYLPYKYKWNSTAKPPLQEYYVVFRSAEQYLIRAEARAKLGFIAGDNSALSDINTIRNRAGLSDTTATDLSEVMNIIERERKLELFTEWGHRWLDLKRWGKSTEVLAPIKTKWNATDTLYPIPRSEINKNMNLKPQNAGYQ